VGAGASSVSGEGSLAGVEPSGVNPPGVVAGLFFRNGFIARRRLVTGLGSAFAAKTSALVMGRWIGDTSGGGEGGRREVGNGGGSSGSLTLFLRLRKKLDGFFCSVLCSWPDAVWLSREGGVLCGFIWPVVCECPRVPALSTEVEET